MLYTSPTWAGDSGAAVLLAKDGRIVGIHVSCQHAAMFLLVGSLLTMPDRHTEPHKPNLTNCPQLGIVNDLHERVLHATDAQRLTALEQSVDAMIQGNEQAGYALLMPAIAWR